MKVLFMGGTSHTGSHAASLLELMGYRVVLTTDSNNAFVHVSCRLVTLVGVRDLIVVETPDAVLVPDKKPVKTSITPLANYKILGAKSTLLTARFIAHWDGATVWMRGIVSRSNVFRSSLAPV